MVKYGLCLILLFFNLSTLAQEVALPSNKPSVTSTKIPAPRRPLKTNKKRVINRPTPKMIWYNPVFIEEGKPGFLRTLFTGEMDPGTRFSLAAPEIFVIQKNNEILNVKSKSLLVDENIYDADANGFFEMVLDLPPGSVQLPIRLTTPAKTSKVYQMNLEVSPEGVALSSQGALEVSPSVLNPGYIWGGVGINYLNFKQDSTEQNVHVGYASFRAPALYLEGLYPLTSRWGLIPSYKSSPGFVGSPETITVNKGNYNWNIIMLEGRYSKRTWKKRIFRRPAKFYLRFGVNQHTVPFWVRGLAATAEIQTNQVNMLTAGIQIDYSLSRDWVLATLLRYQHPFSSGSLFSVQNKISLDSSLGVYYKMKNNWNIGGFFYGQYHTWKFTHKDSLMDENVSGDTELIFSNMELRVGYAF